MFLQKVATSLSVMALLVMAQGVLAQTTAKPSDIQTIIDAVKAAPSQVALNVTTSTDFTEHVLKFDRITIQPGGQINFTDNKAPYYVIATKSLQLRDPSVVFHITPAGAPNLDGQAGSSGTPGAPSWDRNDRTSGQAGGAGGPGGNGTDSQTYDRPTIYLFVGEIRGDTPLTAVQIQRLPAYVHGRGLEGGTGGRGGDGGNGGSGQGGNQSSSGGFNCNRGPGKGGAGGAAGQGGRGGAAARGGNGADVYLVGPQAVIDAISYWTIDTRPGLPGSPGQGGNPGSPGLGGFGGEPRGWCHGHGDEGDRGAYPDPMSLGHGQPNDTLGKRGIIYLVNYDLGTVFK